MAITSGYFNSKGGDRKYNAETMSKYFRGLISRGVLQNFLDKFQVIAAGTPNMTITVKSGRAYFSDGKWMENNADVVLTIQASEVTLNRIDRIVLRKDSSESARTCTIVVKKGTPATDPQPPELDSTDSVEEMSLAQVYVGKLVESIDQSVITDERPLESVCGFVHGLIDQIDTEDLFIQYTQAFNDWFEGVQDTLATATLIRQYTSNYTTTEENETVIPIQIPQYVVGLDILNVFVNGMKLVNNLEYVKTQESVTLVKPLPVGQVVDFEVFKSVDGSDAETVVNQVYDLQQLTNQHTTELAGHETRIGSLETATTDSGWQKLALGSGVTEYNAANYPVRCRKIGKQVYVEGLISNTVAMNVTVATIPDGFRPSKNQIVVTPMSKKTTARHATVIFYATGEVKIDSISSADALAATDYVSLKTSYLID